MIIILLNTQRLLIWVSYHLSFGSTAGFCSIIQSLDNKNSLSNFVKYSVVDVGEKRDLENHTQGLVDKNKVITLMDVQEKKVEIVHCELLYTVYENE